MVFAGAWLDAAFVIAHRANETVVSILTGHG
jgi:hypothetical protein